MNVNATLKARAQLAQSGQPSVRALHDPAVASQSLVTLNTFSRYAVLDATALEVRTASRVVVSLVRMQPARPTLRPAALSRNRGQSVNQLIKHHRVMPIGPSDAKHHWDALAVRDEVALAAKLAPVRGVGACV